MYTLSLTIVFSMLFCSSTYVSADYSKPQLLTDNTIYSVPAYPNLRKCVGVGNIKHTMIITNYGVYKGGLDYQVSYHSTDTSKKDLLELAENNPNDYFIFYSVN